MALRLQKLRDGHDWWQKFLLAIRPLLVRFAMSDIVRTLSYRPKFFGKAFSGLVQSTLRGTSFWTVAERELFAGWVSARNRCAF